MLFIKAFTSYFHIYRPPHTTDRSLTTSSAITHLIAPTAQYTTIGEKPPKSGLIC